MKVKTIKVDFIRFCMAARTALKAIPIGFPIIIFIVFLGLCWLFGVPVTYGAWIDYVATSLAGGVAIIILLTSIT
ncbi:MAG: hypothetical protein GXP00_12750 [Alphaproteobacteria bacterium]|nr:hypothetical protein [Alphaproteobacteria bacterium]